MPRRISACRASSLRVCGILALLIVDAQSLKTDRASLGISGRDGSSILGCMMGGGMEMKDRDYDGRQLLAMEWVLAVPGRSAAWAAAMFNVSEWDIRDGLRQAGVRYG